MTVLGIDTSNYSSSAAYYDSKSDSFVMERKLLPVPEGQLGLRQSDAVFSHVKQMPDVLHALTEKLGERRDRITAVGVSVTPRRAEGSYMPCFLTGKLAASCIAETQHCPLYTFSHQEGHLMAALYSSGSLDLLERPFLAFHVSGGTTEGLWVEPDDESVFRILCVSRTLDLNAGQLVDRVGRMLGCRFPAGPELEELANQWDYPILVRATLKGADFCLSGIENQCKTMLLNGAPAPQIARFCLENVRASLEGSLFCLLQRYGDVPVVLSGGVMSNSILRDAIRDKGDCRFAEPAFSADNAAGIAYYAYLKDQRR